MCIFEGMKRMPNYKRIVPGLLTLISILVTLYIDFGYNMVVLLIAVIGFFFLGIFRFQEILKKENRSIARFKGSINEKLNWTLLVVFCVVTILLLVFLLYGPSRRFMIFKLADSIDGDWLFLMNIMILLPSLVSSFRFYQYFILEEGVFKVSDQHMFSWNEIESYSIQFTDYEVSVSLKFKNGKILDFESRKKMDVDMQGLIALFEKYGILNGEQLSLETGQKLFTILLC